MFALSRRIVLSLPFIGYLLAKFPAFAQSAAARGDSEWRNYGNDLASTRYSPLGQITADNFNDLEVAWRFKADSLGARPEYQYEATPLVIKGRLFTTAGSRRDVVALDAATGELLWIHREDEGERAANAPRQLSGHGVAYWTDGKEERILYVTIGYRLVALDASTGVPVRGFGENGVVDLKKGDDQVMDLVNSDIGLHSTPLIAKDVVVVGAAHRDGSVPATIHNVKGYVRGFDVRTGKRLWIFHTIPQKGEFGYDTWLVPGQAEATGNTGDWAQMSADEELGLVYLGVEMPTSDYTGMYRIGPTLFSDSIVALDIWTGKRKWYYQLLHHDLWDRDIPCAAILCDIPVNGKTVKALAQPSKQVYLYVLNRETGEPIWPIPEKPVPKGDVPGEWYAPTQPVPSKPPPFDNQGVFPENLIDFTPALHAEALEILKNFVTGPVYTPPTMSNENGPYGTLMSPGSQGGANWPGGSYDPETSTVYVYSKTAVEVAGIVHNTDMEASDLAYVHGSYGVQPRPAGPMGAAPGLRVGATAGGARGAARGARGAAAPVGAPAAAAARPRISTTVQGLPLIKPPYGRITAIDLTKGDITWQVAHGETPDAIKNSPALKGLKIPRTGQAANLGVMATKTLVVCGDGGYFTDENGVHGARLRGYDKATGAEKGSVFIPAPQTGSPMTYMLGGQQYIVVAIGGGNYSAELVAFRLPRAG